MPTKQDSHSVRKSGAENAPAKKKKKVHPKPVERPSGLAPAAEAFDAMRKEYSALSPESCRPVNLDIPRAVATALGAEARVQTLVEAMEAVLIQPPTRIISRFRTIALGAWYAHLIAMPAKTSGTTDDMLERATPLRARLLKAADALADAELLDATAIARIREGAGNIDKANDLTALAALFGQSWDVIEDKTAITRAQVDEAALLGPSLLVALSDNPLPIVDSPADIRQRAFTVLVNAYDEIRRAVTFVRWHEGDADAYAPSLYAKTRRKKASTDDEDVEPEDGEGDVDESAPAGPPVVPS